MSRTTFGFAARIAGGNVRAAQAAGPAGRPADRRAACALAGACAGLAGMIEVAAVHGSANASLVAGYGYTGILVAFLARHNPLAIIPVAILLGGIDASGGLIQRRMGLPDATVLVLQGIDLRRDPGQRDALRPLHASSEPQGPRGMNETALGLWSVPLAMLGGAIRVSTPFLFVSLGECLTEKSGRINLGLEGTLVLGAMVGYAVSYMTGSPWLGVLAAGVAGAAARAAARLDLQVPARQRHRHRHRADAVRHGLAFFFGKPFIQPSAPMLPAIPSAAGPTSRRCAPRSRSTRCSSSASRSRRSCGGRSANTRSAWSSAWPATAPTPPAPWATRSISSGCSRPRRRLPRRRRRRLPVALLSRQLERGPLSGQGLMAVALVIFARWNPICCLLGALLFGGAGALGPALQSVGVTQGYYLFNAAPYVLTLLIMIAHLLARRARSIGAPARAEHHQMSRPSAVGMPRASRRHRRSLSLALQRRSAARRTRR